MEPICNTYFCRLFNRNAHKSLRQLNENLLMSLNFISRVSPLSKSRLIDSAVTVTLPLPLFESMPRIAPVRLKRPLNSSAWYSSNTFLLKMPNATLIITFISLSLYNRKVCSLCHLLKIMSSCGCHVTWRVAGPYFESYTGESYLRKESHEQTHRRSIFGATL